MSLGVTWGRWFAAGSATLASTDGRSVVPELVVARDDAPTYLTFATAVYLNER